MSFYSQKKGIVKVHPIFPSKTLKGANLSLKRPTPSVILIDVHPETRNAELADICACFNWLSYQVWRMTAVLRFTRELVPLKDMAHHLCGTCCPAFHIVHLLHVYKQTSCSDSVLVTATTPFPELKTSQSFTLSEIIGKVEPKHAGLDKQEGRFQGYKGVSTALPGHVQFHQNVSGQFHTWCSTSLCNINADVFLLSLTMSFLLKMDHGRGSSVHASGFL